MCCIMFLSIQFWFTQKKQTFLYVAIFDPVSCEDPAENIVEFWTVGHSHINQEDKHVSCGENVLLREYRCVSQSVVIVVL
jgi:hypothetical protein